MVGLAALWVCNIHRVTHHLEDVNLSAYADNWSWAASFLETHAEILQITTAILRKATLTVDWKKTWCWTTSNQDERQLKSLLLDFSGGIVVERKHSAVDLGFHLNYSGTAVRGIVSERISNGYSRIDRVAGLPHDLGVKEHMIRSSVYPCMFHACEIKPPSADDLQRIRSKVACALFGNSHNLCPGIALTLTKGSILDPEFWVLWKVVSSARNFLFTASEEAAKLFLSIASQFQGTLAKVIGPATAFGFCLKRLGFCINKFGGLHVKPFITLQIREVSPKRLLRFCIEAWQENLTTLMSLRKEWKGLPDISRVDTVAMLSKFPCKHRRLLIRSLAGGSQLQRQKAQWTEEDEKCPYCGEEDSRAHRLLNCSIGDQVREQHEDIVHFVTSEESSLPELPVVHVHQCHDYLQALLFKHPSGEFVQTALNVCQKLLDQGAEVHWCTDGSSQHPSLPTARFAGYAVVLDTCSSNEERILVAKQFRYLNELPPTWIPAVCSRTQGEQDILRSEMMAIFEIFENVGHGIIHADSNIAIKNFREMFASTSPAGFKQCEHLDLLSRAWNFRDKISCELVKVKAHQLFSSIEDDLERYWAMGNQAANNLAISAASRLYPSLASELETRASEILEQRKRLHQVYLLDLDLQLFRAKLPAPAASLTGAAWSKQQMVEAFCNWSPTESISFGDFTTDFLGDAIWGEECSLLTLHWLAEFKWPSDTAGPLNKATGISWSELALSWMLHHQRILPVVRPTKDGLKQIIFAGSWKSAAEWQISLSELGQSCRTVLEHSIAMIPEDPMPKLKRGKVPSLYLQGAKIFVSGWMSRPMVPKQSEMVHQVQSMLETCGVDSFLTRLPNFHLVTQEDLFLDKDWLTKHKRASATRKTISKVKKTLA